MSNKHEVANAFAAQIFIHLKELFYPEIETDYFIDLDKVIAEDHFTELIHAMSNVVPLMFYKQLVDEDCGPLDFNHIANKLIFQAAQYAKEEKP